MDYPRHARFYLHNGSHKEIWLIDLGKECVHMQGYTMSPLWGLLFALGGLALAVLAGIVLYGDKQKVPNPKGAKAPEQIKAV